MSGQVSPATSPEMLRQYARSRYAIEHAQLISNCGSCSICNAACGPRICISISFGHIHTTAFVLSDLYSMVWRAYCLIDSGNAFAGEALLEVSATGPEEVPFEKVAARDFAAPLRLAGTYVVHAMLAGVPLAGRRPCNALHQHFIPARGAKLISKHTSDYACCMPSEDSHLPQCCSQKSSCTLDASVPSGVDGQTAMSTGILPVRTMLYVSPTQLSRARGV